MLLLSFTQTCKLTKGSILSATLDVNLSLAPTLQWIWMPPDFFLLLWSEHKGSLGYKHLPHWANAAPCDKGFMVAGVMGSRGTQENNKKRKEKWYLCLQPFEWSVTKQWVTMEFIFSKDQKGGRIAANLVVRFENKLTIIRALWRGDSASWLCRNSRLLLSELPWIISLSQLVIRLYRRWMSILWNRMFILICRCT